MNPHHIKLQRKRNLADSYISEAKFGAPHKPPTFSKPRPPPAQKIPTKSGNVHGNG